MSVIPNYCWIIAVVIAILLLCLGGFSSRRRKKFYSNEFKSKSFYWLGRISYLLALAPIGFLVGWGFDMEYGWEFIAKDTSYFITFFGLASYFFIKSEFLIEGITYLIWLWLSGLVGGILIGSIAQKLIVSGNI